MAIFNGLRGKRFRDMIGLLQQGKSPEVIAEWLDVAIEYVEKHIDLAETLVEESTEKAPLKNDTLEELTGEQLASGDGYELKDLRGYCIDYYGCELASNSSRESTVRAFLEARK